MTMPGVKQRQRVESTVYAPRLVPVWVAVPAAVAGASTVLVLIYLLVQRVVGPGSGTASVASGTGAPALDLIRASIALAGFLGAVLAGVYAYRKQRLAEGDARRADAEQLASRFAQASEQLGHDKAAVRLAGAYAMTALADDWPAQRQMCVSVLTAYLRVPYEPDPQGAGFQRGEGEVRKTIILIIRDHLRDGFSEVSWCGLNFRFEGAVFDGGDLTGARFTERNVTFHGARFVSGTFYFNNIEITGARLWFGKVSFEGGEVSFAGARMSAGLITFEGASVTGGTVTLDGFEHSGGRIDWGPLPPAP